MNYTIPKAALATDAGDGSQSVAPEVGDVVPLPAVMGTVIKDNGDTLEVSVKSIAGQECDDGSGGDSEGAGDSNGDQAPDPGSPMDAQKAKLMKFAKSADTKAGW